MTRVHAHPPFDALDFGQRMDGADVRDWRKARSIKQAVLAEILGINMMTVANWETGRTLAPPFIHLALEAVDRRLSFYSAPQPPPPRPAHRYHVPDIKARARLRALDVRKP